jgi:hypothetical protein
MRVYVVASASLAGGLRFGAFSLGGLLVLLVRSDDAAAAASRYLESLGWLTVFMVVVVPVLVAIWLRLRSAGPLPARVRVVSFADVLRPKRIDLVLLVVIAGLPLLLPAEEAAYYLALLMAAAIGAAAQALVFRVWERRRGAVFLQKAGRTWGFPPLYSAVPGGERWLRSAGVPLQNGPGLIRPV